MGSGMAYPLFLRVWILQIGWLDHTATVKSLSKEGTAMRPKPIKHKGVKFYGITVEAGTKAMRYAIERKGITEADIFGVELRADVIVIKMGLFHSIEFNIAEMDTFVSAI